MFSVYVFDVLLHARAAKSWNEIMNQVYCVSNMTLDFVLNSHRVSASLVFLVLVLLLLSACRTISLGRLVRSLAHVDVPSAHRFTLRTPLPLSALPSVVLICAAIVPPHVALAIVASYPERDNLFAPLTVADPKRLLVILVLSSVIVRLFEVRMQLHQRTGRKGIVARARKLQEAVCDQRLEDGICLAHGDSCIGSLALPLLVRNRCGLALPAAPRARQLARLGLLDRHGLARRRVIRLEHGVQQAADVGNLARREAGCELRHGVRRLVHKRVRCLLRLLVARMAYLEVVGFQTRVDGLDRRRYEGGLRYVADGEGASGFCEM